MTDTQVGARGWTRCLAALVLAALASLLTSLAHASSLALTILAAVLAVAPNRRRGRTTTIGVSWPCYSRTQGGSPP